MYTSITYLTYITISIFITVFVSRTLSKNGEIFLIDGFGGNAELAKSVNHLLVVGFYLVNLGFVLLKMRTNAKIENIEGMIVYLSSGVGFVLLVLGLAHFFNMYVIHQFRNSHTATSYDQGFQNTFDDTFANTIDHSAAGRATTVSDHRTAADSVPGTGTGRTPDGHTG